MPNLKIRSSTPLAAFDNATLREIQKLTKHIESLDDIVGDGGGSSPINDASDLLATHANFLNEVAKSHVAATDPRVLKTMRDTHDLLKSMAPDPDDDEDTESDEDADDDELGQPLTEAARSAARRYDFAFDSSSKARMPGAIGAVGMTTAIADRCGAYQFDSFEKRELKEVGLTESRSRARPVKYDFTFENVR